MGADNKDRMGPASRPFVNFQNMSSPTAVKHRPCAVRSHRLIRPPMKRRNSRNFGSRSDLFYLRPCVRLFLFAHSSIIIRERITGVELGLCRIGDSGLPDCDICASGVSTLYFIPRPSLSMSALVHRPPIYSHCAGYQWVGRALSNHPFPLSIHPKPPLSAIVAACHRDQSSNDGLTMDRTYGSVIKHTIDKSLTNHWHIKHIKNI